MEENIASELRDVSRETRETVLDYLNRADRDYGGRVAEKSRA
ncbi:catalase-related domain-containing protein [Intestinimonas butyriciproducens]